MKNNDIKQNLELNLEELSEEECDAVVGGMMRNNARTPNDNGGYAGSGDPASTGEAISDTAKLTVVAGKKPFTKKPKNYACNT